MTENETILETERLILRKWTEADCDALFEIMRDEEVARNIGDGKPFSIEKSKAFLVRVKIYERENGFCRWKVFERSNGKTIGSGGFALLPDTKKIDPGYLTARESWGKGYATEIAGAAVHYGFKKPGFREIIAMTDLENTASQKVFGKNRLPRTRHRGCRRRRKFSFYKEKI